MAIKPKTLVKRVTVALNFPLRNTEFILLAKAIYKSMFNNPTFTASTAKIALLNTDIIVLDAAQVACRTTPPTCSVDDRNVAMEIVKNDLRSLRSDVQVLVDANPAQAEAIITSAGMSIKKANTHSNPQNTAKDGVEEGSVELIGEGAGVHDWRMSVDNIEWTFLSSSKTRKTNVFNLTPGNIYYFQNRRMLYHDEKTEWSQSIKIRVK